MQPVILYLEQGPSKIKITQELKLNGNHRPSLFSATTFWPFAAPLQTHWSHSCADAVFSVYRPTTLQMPRNPERAAESCSSCLIPSASLAPMSLSLWPSALVSHGGPDRIARFSKKNMRCPVRFELQIHNKSFLSTSHAITEHLLYLSDIQGGCGSNPRE